MSQTAPRSGSRPKSVAFQTAMTITSPSGRAIPTVIFALSRAGSSRRTPEPYSTSASQREPTLRTRDDQRREFWRQLGDQLLSIYRARQSVADEEVLQFERTRKRRESLDDASLIAQALFGCALLFALRD